MRKRWTDKSILKAMKLRDEGLSTSEMAEILYASEQEVKDVLKRVDEDLLRSEHT